MMIQNVSNVHRLKAQEKVALNDRPVDFYKGDSSIRTIPDFPYSRNADFVGCEAIIDEMNHALQISNRLALNGIGGVG